MVPASIRKKQGGASPSREELEREAALELQRASGRPTGAPSVGDWTPPAFGQAMVTDDEGPAEGWGEDDLDADEDDDEEGAVTELALNWLADQDRRGPRRSAEDMVVRVDVSSATAARDLALQAHLERQEMLKKAQVTPPWGKKPLTIGKPFSTKKHPLGKKAKKKKAVAKTKKALAKKVAATPTVPMIDAESLPLEDYEALSAAQILSVLDQLDDDDLNLVGDYEEQHRNRPEILDAIDDLFEDPAAPPAKKKAVAKKAAAKVTTKKAGAKKAVAKKATVPVASPDEDLPIENYDRLTPSQILMVLDELDDDDLDLVAEYEAEHRNRSEILDAIDAMFDEQDEDLPIENYDRLTPSQILMVLDELDDDDLDLVAEYEAEHRNRPEILDAIDDLLKEPPPPPVKRTFVKKAAVKKVPVKKVVSKKAVSKKVPAEKTVVKKVPARKVVARKAGVKKAGAEVAKATVKKVAVKKSPVKKVTVKKAGARKSVLR
ncbi:MAG: hypothetical protein H0U41_02565 [Actinobacteria bacterium]|nr:hypothetical protein [Actinomycetota bacterium]